MVRFYHYQEREAAEKKIKRDAKRNVGDYDEVVLTTLPLEAYAKIVEEVNKLDLKELQRPAPTPTAGGNR